MYERMFYMGMFLGLLNLGISVILFVKNRLRDTIRDMMGWRKNPIVPDEYKKEEMTDVLVKQELCVERLFQMEEDIVVIHTENRM